jgi:hypothetical protein
MERFVLIFSALLEQYRIETLVATVDPKTPRAKQDFGEFRMQFVGPGF